MERRKTDREDSHPGAVRGVPSGHAGESDLGGRAVPS
nr:MAG TPA: hypothetical protein [Caudoviricetes sp.]